MTIGISGGAAIAPPVIGLVSGTYGVAASFGAMAVLGMVCLALTAVVLRVGDARTPASPQPSDD